jgi:DNA repair protein RecN (Recombination protein N)
MIKQLRIQNFAIIDQMTISLSDSLNIITGETGAGKSILLGALGLLMGERAQSNSAKNPEAKCIVEGTFDVSKLNIKSWFEANELDYADETIIRRELLPGGKSRAFVNDTPCTIQVLSELGLQLVDIFSQHDSLELKNHDYQLKIIDAFAQNDTLLKQYAEVYNRLRKNKSTYESLLASHQDKEKEKELLQYHLQEMLLYPFEEWDFAKMENDLVLMENAVDIKQSLSASVHLFKSDEQNLQGVLQDILNRQRKFEKVSKDLEALNDSFQAVFEEMKEVFNGYERLEEGIEFDEEQINNLREQIDFINKLMLKHRKQHFKELVEYKNELESKLEMLENSDTHLLELKEQLKKDYIYCMQLAENLTEKRKATFDIVEKTLMSYLVELGMENSQFKIWINSSKDHMRESGIDQVRFLFSANKGIAPQDLKNAISGGEMSRFMLSIKSMMAKKIHLPCLIFDEIDTGVSGIVANKVANILEELTAQHQVVAITHLPQIASRGSHHLYIYKDKSADITQSSIKILSPQEREMEIAKMIAGDQVTETSLAGARELLKR